MKKEYIAPRTTIYTYTAKSSLLVNSIGDHDGEYTSNPLNVDDDIVSSDGMAWMKGR